jgi:hypothetical protein
LITATPLILALQACWGETQVLANGVPQTYDGKQDYPRTDARHPDKGPLFLAFAVEKGAPRDPSVKLQTPRLIFVGNDNFLSNAVIYQAPIGKDFLVNSVNWLLGRESFIQLPPKEKVPNDVNLSDDQVSKLGWTVILGLPFAFGLLGLYYLTWRHGRNILAVTAAVVAVLLIIWGGIITLQRWAADSTSNDSAPPPSSGNGS